MESDALDAAMTVVPRLLMADWITMLASENTALCMPAGRPMWMMDAADGPSQRSLEGVTRMGASILSSRTSSTSALVT